MSKLRDLLAEHIDNGPVPGAVALVARGDQVDVQAVGSVDVEGSAPMARDSIFRIASITKPIVAAAMMMLVEEGRFGLDDAVSTWLPELASPMVVRTPQSPVTDVLPAARPITVADLLTFRAGYGYPADFTLPAVAQLFELQNGPMPERDTDPDEWLAGLARVPLLHQPGEAWLYNTCSDIQGVLIARVAGRPLAEFLAERIFEPLGMADTGFFVPADKLDRFTNLYQPNASGELELLDARDGEFTTPPCYPSGAGGLACTVDDWYAFARMLLAGGSTDDGRRLLSADTVRQMTTDHLTAAQREVGDVFLRGQGWGYGGSVDLARTHPWNVPGRYGWVGGTGTAAYLTPSTGVVEILLTNLAMTGPTSTTPMRDFWRYAATT